ncbi:hypothetical protein SO694_001040111 [Aureococcus anophagefferens]|uniref:Expansin-like EG45 domain-containing protein n=1 Tax=Aureococcus anophagefferens TaxID=44056 RepID=A0ABR1FMG9_AURAN
MRPAVEHVRGGFLPSGAAWANVTASVYVGSWDDEARPANPPSRCSHPFPNVDYLCIVSGCYAPDCRNVVRLNFAGADVALSNLDGSNPFFPAELRLANVGIRANGRPFDVVVAVEGSYGGVGGVDGDFLTLTVDRGASTTFAVRFEDSATGNPADVHPLYVTLVDVDGLGDVSEAACLEAADFDGYVLGDDVAATSTKTTCDGLAAGASTTFASTADGYGCDDPSDAFDLGVVTCEACYGVDACASSQAAGFPVDQAARAVMWAFTAPRSSFDVVLSAPCPGCAASSATRTFKLAGASSLAPCLSGPSAAPSGGPAPAPSSSPVVAPTPRPTPAPTPAPAPAPTPTPTPLPSSAIDAAPTPVALDPEAADKDDDDDELLGPGAAAGADDDDLLSAVDAASDKSGKRATSTASASIVMIVLVLLLLCLALTALACAAARRRNQPEPEFIDVERGKPKPAALLKDQSKLPKKSARYLTEAASASEANLAAAVHDAETEVVRFGDGDGEEPVARPSLAEAASLSEANVVGAVRDGALEGTTTTPRMSEMVILPSSDGSDLAELTDLACVTVETEMTPLETMAALETDLTEASPHAMVSPLPPPSIPEEITEGPRESMIVPI